MYDHTACASLYYTAKLHSPLQVYNWTVCSRKVATITTSPPHADACLSTLTKGNTEVSSTMAPIALLVTRACKQVELVTVCVTVKVTVKLGTRAA